MSNPWMTRGAIPLLLLAKLRVSRLTSVVATLTLSGVIPVVAGAQQQAAAARSLVFEGVTVVDVEHGRLIPAQRVVIAGNRIKAVGAVGAVKMPNGAQVVEARGKYLIPGLWDMHTHSERGADIVSYPLLLANGVTGIRDAGSSLPLDTLRQWRREILAGTRVGPPRQLLSGGSINRPRNGAGCVYAIWVCISDPFDFFSIPRGPESFVGHARRIGPAIPDSSQIARARQVVDSLWAGGADMIKPRELGREMYFVVAAEARRLGIPFGGHAEVVTALEASDSGARIVDHLSLYAIWTEDLCGTRPPSTEQCRLVAERLRRNGTWLTADSWHDVGDSRFSQRMREFVTGSPLPGNWLRGSAYVSTVNDSTQAKIRSLMQEGDSAQAKFMSLMQAMDMPTQFMSLMQEVDMPILAASDGGIDFSHPSKIGERLPGFILHANLAGYVVLGFTPLHALQTATLNPAKMLRATDSLGTVAPGKLADLVLLDADPLADITNTTAIRAVVANGRYFDRTALDALLAKVQAETKQEP